MSKNDLTQILKAFALEVVKYCRKIPSNTESIIFKKQLIRSATSAAANYRSACSGRSRKEWYTKMCIALEATDESNFWLDFLEAV